MLLPVSFSFHPAKVSGWGRACRMTTVVPLPSQAETAAWLSGDNIDSQFAKVPSAALLHCYLEARGDCRNARHSLERPCAAAQRGTQRGGGAQPRRAAQDCAARSGSPPAPPGSSAGARPMGHSRTGCPPRPTAMRPSLPVRAAARPWSSRTPCPSRFSYAYSDGKRTTTKKKKKKKSARRSESERRLAVSVTSSAYCSHARIIF